MISLFLDTCSAKLIVGVYNEIDPIVLNIEENDNHLSERILPLIDNTLKQANKKISDINNIIVVNGPGSFTGIRIGVTVAKMLAWCGNIKISTVSELEVLASDPNQYTASLIDARRGYVYAGLYDKDGKNIIKDQHIKLTDFMIMLKKYKDVVIVSNDTFEIDNLNKPCLNIDKIVERHLNDEGQNPHGINPQYLKLTEAEERLNDKRNN